MRKRFVKTVAAGAATLALGAGALTGLGPLPGGASSHREAPLTASDPRIDNTDVYAFVSPDDPDSVTIISNWIPFEEPAGGPNFYSFAPNMHYDVNIDNDGNAKPDIIYRWVFHNHYRNPNTFLYNTGVVGSLTDPDLNFYQTYKLQRITPGGTTTVTHGTAAPSDVGKDSMPDYAALSNAAIQSLPGGGKVWAGQSDDPFFLDLRVFDGLYGGFHPPGLDETSDDTLAGFNVNALAIQVPKSKLAKGDVKDNPIIGVWSTASRRTTRVEKPNGSQSFTGDFVEVSRLGMPLVNEVVIPVGKKDFWNRTQPANDVANFGAYIVDPELPELLQALYGIPAPDNCPNNTKSRCRTDLVALFATGLKGLNQPANVKPGEMLRLNMSIPPCQKGSCKDYSALGVIGGDNAGYPNGRRLADDTIDISLQVVEGEADPVAPCPCKSDLGDGVDENDVSFRGAFPYLALPHRGSDPSPH